MMKIRVRCTIYGNVDAALRAYRNQVISVLLCKNAIFLKWLDRLLVKLLYLIFIWYTLVLSSFIILSKLSMRGWDLESKQSLYYIYVGLYTSIYKVAQYIQQQPSIFEFSFRVFYLASRALNSYFLFTRTFYNQKILIIQV